MKVALIFLIFVTHILMSYNGSIWPLRALIGSFLITVIARAAWPTEWKGWLGLRIPPRAGIKAAVCALILIACFYWMVRGIASAQDITYQSPVVEHGILSLAYLHTLGQTLNEEMLFGALVLVAVLRTLPRTSPLMLALLIALGFSLLHYAFYAWIVIPPNSGTLTSGALFVLFVIGVLRNSLIMKTGHIAYSWSAHLSINLVGLLGTYTFENGLELSEPQIFNFILGSRAAVILSFFVLSACVFSLLRVNAVKDLQAELAEIRSDSPQRGKNQSNRK